MRNTTTTIAETPTSKNNPRRAAVTFSPPYVFERLHPRTSVNPVATRIDRASPGEESLARSVPIGSTQWCDANQLHISTARPLVVLVHSRRCADGHHDDPEEAISRLLQTLISHASPAERSSSSPIRVVGARSRERAAAS